MTDRRSSTLRAQIFLRTLVVVLIPLALLAVVAVLGLRSLERTAAQGVDTARQDLAANTVTARLRSEAEATARELDLVLASHVNDVVTWSRQPAVIDGAEVASQQAIANDLIGLSPEAAEERFAGSPTLGTSPSADAFLATELERRGLFLDVTYTDRNGFTAGGVSPEADFVQSDEAWWLAAWEDGIHVGALVEHPVSGQLIIPIASRIEDDSGKRVGVLRASLDAGLVQDVTDQRTTEGLDLVVLSDARIVLADTASAHAEGVVGVSSLPDEAFPPGALLALDGTREPVVGEEWAYGFSSVVVTGDEPTGAPGSGREWPVVARQSIDAAFAPLAGLDSLDRDLGQAGRRLSFAMLGVLAISLLIAAVASAVISRKLVKPVRLLTEGARRAAEEDLPLAVSMAQNEDDGAMIDAAIDVRAGNELDELADSFNSVQRTAVRLAAEQAHQRRTTSEMFANLGRRNQSLVKRQLRFIEELERSEEDPDRLASLFKLDHLATRMRRNAESLLVIAGHRGNNRRSAPVHVGFVAQAALGEVEDFERVDLSGLEPVSVAGRAVGDVAHILAELIENALSFSPPEAPVSVSGTRSLSQYEVSVSDRGIGLAPDELSAINERLIVDDKVDLTPSKQLGLLVVAKLAARHGLTVRLESSASGGVTAIVEIPASLIQTPTDTGATPAVTGADSGSDVEPTDNPAPMPVPAPLRVRTAAAAPAAVESDETEPALPEEPGFEVPAAEVVSEFDAPSAEVVAPEFDAPVTEVGASEFDAPSAEVVSAFDAPVTEPEVAPAVVDPVPVDADAGVESEDVPVPTTSTWEPSAATSDTSRWEPPADAPVGAGEAPAHEFASFETDPAVAGAALDQAVEPAGSAPGSIADRPPRRRVEDGPRTGIDEVFRAAGGPPSTGRPRPQVSEDPALQRRTSDAGFGISPATTDEPLAATDDPGDGIEAPPGWDADTTRYDDPGPEARTFEGDDLAVPVRPDDDEAGLRSRYIGSISSTSTSQISDVRRRPSRRPGERPPIAPPAAPKEKRAVATTDSHELVEHEAKALRDRWSSFQSARRKADRDGDDETGTTP